MPARRTAPLDPAGVRVHRAGSGPVLVMLHCLGMTHRLWDCLEGLADQYTLLRYDFPGHGETPVPARPYGIEELSAQLAALMQRQCRRQSADATSGNHDLHRQLSLVRNALASITGGIRSDQETQACRLAVQHRLIPLASACIAPAAALCW